MYCVGADRALLYCGAVVIEFVSKVLVPGLALLCTAIGAAFAIHTYWRNAKTRRAEWLYSLYAKFYEDSFYKEIRSILDYKPEKELQLLYSGLRDGSNQ